MSEARSGWGSIGLGIALALGMLASSVVVSRAVIQVKQENQALEVKGFAEKQIVSDFASWRGSFTTRAPELTAAYEQLSRHREAVEAFLVDQGVPQDAYELFPVGTSVLFAKNAQGMMTNEVEGYALSQEIGISSADIGLVSSVSKNSADLVEQGVEFSSYRPEYFYTRLGELKISMLADATADARQRAEVLAENGGGRIGHLLSARQGVFQITPAHSTEISDYGRNDTSSREKSIKAVVTVRYAVER
jgi:hypothetical protein